MVFLMFVIVNLMIFLLWFVFIKVFVVGDSIIVGILSECKCENFLFVSEDNLVSIMICIGVLFILI